MGIIDAAADGSRLKALRALRDSLAARLERCTSDQNFAVMSRVLADVLVQIDELGGGVAPAKEETALDEFSRRLAERQSTSTPARRTGRQ